jgi:YfiR/HmsC-like
MKPSSRTIRFQLGAMAPQCQGIRKCVALAALIIGASPFAAKLPAQQQKPDQNQVEAAYIYNFGKFVKWPTTSGTNQNSSFTICVLGEDPYGSILQSVLAGKFINGIPVTIKRVPQPQDAIDCRILSINTTDERRLREILTDLGPATVLTVSDMPNFTKRGGMIQFVTDGDRVRFEINRASSDRAGLVLASELLKVATVVRGAGEAGGH